MEGRHEGEYRMYAQAREGGRFWEESWRGRSRRKMTLREETKWRRRRGGGGGVGAGERGVGEIMETKAGYREWGKVAT